MFNQILRIKESGDRKEGKERKEPLLTASFSPLSILSIHSLLSMMVLMILCVACSNSPVEEDNQGKETPDLEKILKDMVLIPAGEFLMGSSEGEGAFDEHPQHKVYLDAYYIDKYEVTNAQFKEFVDATGYVTDAERKGYGEVWNPKEWEPGWQMLIFSGVNWRQPNKWREPHPDAWEIPITDKMNHPVVQISWNDAQAYANWLGKRLPTEAEWEKAARGTKGNKWPWGNVFEVDIGGVTIHTNIAGEDTVPVDSFPTGASPYGVFNMAGNVQEWVFDWYSPDYYAKSPKENPKGPDNGKFRVLRGGSWRDAKGYQVLTTSRAYQTPDYRSNLVGFRCALSP